MTAILTGWREQYERMHRSYARFCVTSAGATSVPSAEARDDLIHFLQDAYHLKDWLQHDSASCSLTGTLESTSRQTTASPCALTYATAPSI